MTVSQREQVITLGVALAMAAAFTFFLALPRAKQLREVKQEEARLRDEIARANEISKESPQLHQEVKDLKVIVADLEKRIPSEDHTATYEDNLWELGKKYGLCGLRDEKRGSTFFEHRKTEEDGSIKIKEARLTFTSDFPRFYKFLKDLEAMEELTEIDGIEFRPRREGASIFDITMDLSYFYGELAGS